MKNRLILAANIGALAAVLCVGLFAPDHLPHAGGFGILLAGITLDVFKQDAFNTMTLLTAVDKVPYQPSFLRDLNLFDDMPVRTPKVFIESRNGVLSLIQTTPRGAPPSERTTEKRQAFAFDTTRVAQKDRIMADELLGIRAFGSETELEQAQAEVMRRLAGPTGLKARTQYTWENMYLGALQGLLVDADGSTIYNFFTAFDIAQPTEIAFDFTGANAAGTTIGAPEKLRPFIAQNVTRPIMRAAKGAFTSASEIWALCGDAFFDDLRSHGDVKQTYLNQIEAQELRKGIAFETFTYANVTWVNYRGSDDASTIAVPTDKCKFFVKNAPGVYKQAWAPAEFLPYVGTLGQPIYPFIVLDDDIPEAPAWVEVRTYSYPLPILTRPELAYSGRRTA